MADVDEIRTDRVYKGDVWFTGVATFEEPVNLLDGVELDAASIVSGVIAHERGGLELDVSAFDGLVKISGGATAAVSLSTFGATLLDDADAAAARATLGLGALATASTVAWGDVTATPSTLAGYGITDAASDAELASHEAATVGPHGITAFAATLLDDVNAGAARATLGLSTLAQSGAWSDLAGIPAAVDAIDGLTPAANKLAYYTGASSAALANFSVTGRLLAGAADAASARNYLDLEAIAATGNWSDLAGIPAAVDAIDGLTPAANKLAYYTGASSATLVDLTAFGRSLLDDANAAAGRSTLGLGSLATASTVGTGDITDDAVTYAKMQDVTATDKLLGRASSGAGVVEEITCTAAGRALLDDASATAQRTTLGVGTGDTPTFAGVRATYTGGLYVDDAGTPLGRIYYSGGLLIDRAATAAFFVQENGSTQFSIAAGGNASFTQKLGVGAGASSSYQLYVLGDGSNLCARFDSGGALAASFEFTRTTATAAAGDTVGAFDVYNGATRVGQYGFYADGATDSGRFEIYVKPTGAGLARPFIVNSSQNLLLGGATAGGSSLAKGVVLSNGTAPSSYPAVQLWAESGELKVADTAGNVTTLSPHADDGPAALYDEAPGLEWVVPHVNAFAGAVRWYNLTRAISGRSTPGKPAYIVETFGEYNQRRGLAPGDAGHLAPADWEAHEAALAAAAELEREAWQAAKDADDARRADLLAAGLDPGEPRPIGEKPRKRTPRPRPAWLGKKAA